MNYNKERLKIKDKLRKAQTKRDYIACTRYEARLKEIDNLQVQGRRLAEDSVNLPTSTSQEKRQVDLRQTSSKRLC